MRLDNNIEVPDHIARSTIMTLEQILGVFGEEGLANVQAVCLVQSRRFFGARKTELEDYCLGVGLIRQEKSDLVAGSEDIAKIIRSCVKKNGEKMRIQKPRSYDEAIK